LAALSELSGEIGFTDEDIRKFQRCLELSVIAPRIGHAHVLEGKYGFFFLFIV
jgi:hypothetical protein